MKTFFYKIRNYIKNLIRWSPTLWEIGDHDFYHIYSVLEVQLKNTADYIKKKDAHVSSQRDYEIMMTAVRLIKLVKDDYYENEFHEYCTFSDAFFKNVNDDNSFSEYFEKYWREYEKIKSDHLDDYGNAVLLSMHIQEKAKKLLFKIISENINTWWV